MIPGINSQPLVSVIIPTYNRARFLKMAIESVMQQTYSNFELLIIDDGSTDTTAEVVSEYLKDPRVSYHWQPNGKQVAAKNKGIQLAKGEYIGFLDDDDMWASEKLKLQVNAFQNNKNVSILYSPYFYIDENNNIIEYRNSPCYEGNVTGQLLIENFIGFGTVLIKRECFDNLGGFDKTLTTGVDYDLWLRFSTRYRFGYVPAATLYYRIWPEQITAKQVKIYENGIKIMERFLQTHPGLVEQHIQNMAWAHTYVNLGNCIRKETRRVAAAMNCYLRALQHKPTHLPAWKSIAKTVLNQP